MQRGSSPRGKAPLDSKVLQKNRPRGEAWGGGWGQEKMGRVIADVKGNVSLEA